jgi:tRNA1(Val) A37 N6-methylase TrmN6
MERHETPLTVAALLAKWAPQRMTNLLEPAVGNGALLIPFLPIIRKTGCQVVCVDVDFAALARVEDLLSNELAGQLKLVHADFLNIQPGLLEQGPIFDCIVMNPPFASRIRRLVHVNSNGDTKYVPIEVAFLTSAIERLRDGGVLLSVVPSSVISSLQGRWVREHLLRAGCIRYVHELPRNTFSLIEAKAYLLVFQKGRAPKTIMLCNHSLSNPDILLLKSGLLGNDIRLDFSHQKARAFFSETIDSNPDVGWKRLGDIATVTRGSAASPTGYNRAVHTTDFRDGFWSSSRLEEALRNLKPSNFSANSNDILMMRVGRHCHKSVGCLTAEGSCEITDCVLRIRPQDGIDKILLLFALRCILCSDVGRNFIQRGGGASYIVPKDLESLFIPYDAHLVYKDLFLLYVEAVKDRRYEVMEWLERRIQSNLAKGVRNK